MESPGLLHEAEWNLEEVGASFGDDMFRETAYDHHPHYDSRSALSDIRHAAQLARAIQVDIGNGEVAPGRLQQLLRLLRRHGAATEVDIWAGGRAQLAPRITYLASRLDSACALLEGHERQLAAAKRDLARVTATLTNANCNVNQQRRAKRRAHMAHRRARNEVRRLEHAVEQLQQEREELRAAAVTLQSANDCLEGRLAQAAVDRLTELAQHEDKLLGKDAIISDLRGSLERIREACLERDADLAAAVKIMRNYFKDARVLKRSKQQLEGVIGMLQAEVAAALKCWNEEAGAADRGRTRSDQLQRELDDVQRQKWLLEWDVRDARACIQRLMDASARDFSHMDQAHTQLQQKQEALEEMQRKQARLKAELLATQEAGRAAQAVSTEAWRTAVSLRDQVAQLQQLMTSCRTAAAQREEELLAEAQDQQAIAAQREAGLLAAAAAHQEQAQRREAELVAAMQQQKEEAEEREALLLAAIGKCKADAKQREVVLLGEMAAHKEEAERREAQLLAAINTHQVRARLQEEALASALATNQAQKAEAEHQEEVLRAAMATRAAAAEQKEAALLAAIASNELVAKDTEETLRALQGTVEELLTKVKELDGLVKDTSKKKDVAEAAFTQAMSRLGTATSSNRKLTSRVQLLSVECTAAQTGKAAAEQESKALKGENQRLTKKLERRDEEKASLEKSYEELRRKIQVLDNLQDAYAKAQIQLQTLEELERKYAQAIDQKTTADRQKQDAQRTARDAITAKKAAESSMRDADRRIADLKKEVEALKAAVAEGKAVAAERLQETAAVVAERDTLKCKLGSIENQAKAELYDRVQALEAKLMEADIRFAHEHATRNNLANKLQSSEAGEACMGKKYHGAQEEAECWKQQLSAKQQELDAVLKQQVMALQKVDTSEKRANQERQRATDLEGQIRSMGRDKDRQIAVERSRAVAAEGKLASRDQLHQAQVHRLQEAHLLSMHEALQDAHRVNHDLRLENERLRRQLDQHQ